MFFFYLFYYTRIHIFLFLAHRCDRPGTLVIQVQEITRDSWRSSGPHAVATRA